MHYRIKDTRTTWNENIQKQNSEFDISEVKEREESVEFREKIKKKQSYRM